MIITEHFAETKTGLAVPRTADLVRLCEDRIRELREYTLKHLQYPMPETRLSYDLKGKVAGTANSSKNLIRINYVLLKENTEHFIKQTLGHEYAHLITDNLWLSDLISKPTAHGREWKKVMRQLGLPPDRCHSYDTTNSSTKKQRRWKYTCGCTGRPHMISTTIHNRIKGGRKYRCQRCGKPITR
jgi:SprT protein